MQSCRHPSSPQCAFEAARGCRGVPVDRGILDRAVHPLDLTAGPWVTRFGPEVARHFLMRLTCRPEPPETGQTRADGARRPRYHRRGRQIAHATLIVRTAGFSSPLGPQRDNFRGAPRITKGNVAAQEGVSRDTIQINRKVRPEFRHHRCWTDRSSRSRCR
ncbi:hypothetical protein DFP92_11565 [Yoonia sediminilitoris]|uniref:Uncharacterized protein n=1 Tax=Yoonia sediminilitoris TaxID=1286148 RepID=A0A2T6K8K7_9RHOB|nr:hypothetical protein C8N45_11565 [Yoonia sediminilitoris]RCW91000.1 hypothetical protein DFP92_11565 [Yoonia sediminilitoris]